MIFKARDEALKKFKMIKTQESWTEYKVKRNFALASVRREKAAYLSFLHQQHLSKKLWFELKNLGVTSSTKKSSQLPDHLCKPSEVNDYFASVFESSVLSESTYYLYLAVTNSHFFLSSAS